MFLDREGEQSENIRKRGGRAKAWVRDETGSDRTRQATYGLL